MLSKQHMVQVIQVHMVQVTSRSIMVQDTTQCTWFRLSKEHMVHFTSRSIMVQDTTQWTWFRILYTVHMVQYILGSTWFKLLSSTQFRLLLGLMVQDIPCTNGSGYAQVTTPKFRLQQMVQVTYSSTWFRLIWEDMGQVTPKSSWIRLLMGANYLGYSWEHMVYVTPRRAWFDVTLENIHGSELLVTLSIWLMFLLEHTHGLGFTQQPMVQYLILLRDLKCFKFTLGSSQFKLLLSIQFKLPLAA